MTYSRISFWVFAVLSLSVAIISYRFLLLGLETAFSGMSEYISSRKLAFLLHVTASPIALALGVFQFVPKLRQQNPALHRWSGRVYGLAVLTGGITGLVLAIGSLDRPVAAAGFGFLSVIWLTITANAVRLAMAGQISRHRRWMIRSFALTFAAVTLRLTLPLFMIFGGMDYTEASNYVAWLCWVPNLAAVEWFIRRKSVHSAPALQG